MKLLVTGAGGGLGTSFVRWAAQTGLDADAFSRAQIDISDADAVAQAVQRTNPDVIVNCAAFTNVDASETEQDKAFRANALGPQHLAVSAESCGAILVHISTDYVFDGEKGSPYDERDSPNPRSEYAMSKLAGEEFVRSSLERHFIVRTGWVFGGGTDFLSRATNRLANGENVGGLVDRWGTPTYVRHLAERLIPLVETGRFGTYHVTGPETTTWFDVLRRVKEIGGWSGSLEEQHADELKLPANRPKNSALTSRFLADLGIAGMPALDIALKEFLNDRER